MKFFLTVLSVALVAQVSLAANIGRVKRADEVETAMGDLMKLGLELVDMSIKIGEDLIEHMPETEEFATYRRDFTQFLAIANEVKSKEGNCVIKTTTALKALFELFEKYNDENVTDSEESKAFDEVFAKFGGEQFEKDAKAFQEKYFNEEFLNKLENYSENDIEKWALFEQVC